MLLLPWQMGWIWWVLSTIRAKHIWRDENPNFINGIDKFIPFRMTVPTPKSHVIEYLVGKVIIWEKTNLFVVFIKLNYGSVISLNVWRERSFYEICTQKKKKEGKSGLSYHNIIFYLMGWRCSVDVKWIAIYMLHL